MHSPSLEPEVHLFVPIDHPVRAFARMLVVLVLATALALLIVPWRQTAPAKGRVIAYAPVDRQQTIDAPIDGRITRWYVHEGARVDAGDAIVDITDNDPQILARLGAERDAVEARIVAARARVTAIEQRITAMRSSQKSAVTAAGRRTRMAEDRLNASQRAVEASEAAAKAADLNYERQKALFDQGLTSKRAVELAEADEVRTRTDVDRARAVLSAARAEVGALEADVTKVDNDAFASINDAQAARASAEAEIASGLAELARMDVRIARQETQHVKAPARGTILRVVARQGAEMVKAGDSVALFVPETSDRAVELMVEGNDVNLVHPERSVRLQFEGWPAVQFSGWPSAAVGTYGGRVAFVDATDDGQGRFRIVIVPDGVAPWPEPSYLRQGTRAYGWVLLGRVSLGYELWRQFNGFPPEWTGAPESGNAPRKDAAK